MQYNTITIDQYNALSLNDFDGLEDDPIEGDMGHQLLEITLGPAFTGLTLHGQYVDTTQTNVGSPVTTGFTEVGVNGDYWTNLTPPADNLFFLIYDSNNNYLCRAATNIVSSSVFPLTVTVTGDVVAEQDITVYQNTEPEYQWELLDLNGDPVDLTGHNLSFIAYRNTITPTGTTVIETEANLIISGSGGDVVSVQLSLIDTSSPARLRYVMRDNTANLVLVGGAFIITAAPGGDGTD